jgi:hypothetical protein
VYALFSTERVVGQLEAGKGEAREDYHFVLAISLFSGAQPYT